MNKQDGMVMALLLAVLCSAVLALSYFLWSKHQHQVIMDAKLLQLQNDLSASRDEVKVKNIALSEQTTASFKIQQQLNRVIDKEQQLERELKRVNNTSTATIAVNKDLEQQNQRFKQQLADFNALTTKNNSLQEALANLTASSEAQVAQLAALTGVQEKNTQLVQQVDSLTAHLKQQQQAADAQGQENAGLQQQVTGLTAELKSLTDASAAEHKRLLAENTGLMEQLAALNTERNTLAQASASRAEQLMAKNTDLQQQLTALSAKIEELTQASSGLNQEYVQARKQLESERTRVQGVNQQLETLEQQLDREQHALDELEAEMDKLNNTNESLSEVNHSLNKTNVELHLEKQQLVQQYKDGITVIRIPNRVLFDSGSADINARGEQTLSLIAKALKAFSGHLVSVEGHTDSRTIGADLARIYPSNWELSSARASSAIRLLVNHGLPAKQFQAVGFGETRPLVSGKDHRQLRQNRRIEILLLPPVEREQKLLSVEGEGGIMAVQ